jgi:ABC-type tungstate transport system permease subunit
MPSLQCQFAQLQTIKTKAAPFISRGDRSGTHIAELNLWKVAGIDIAADHGPWYKEIGQGMGAALNMASASNAYVLSEARGSRSRTAATSPLWSRATSACSISTA